MAEDLFTRKCWCEKCNKFVDMRFHRVGLHQTSTHIKNVIFSYSCPECRDKDIEEMSEQDWTLLETNVLTHFNFR